MKVLNARQALEEAIEIIKKGTTMCLVTIEETIGSTPRTKDAFMFVDENANIWGTVGGGRVELEAIKDASLFLKNRENGTKKYFLDSTSKENLQMVCGGNVVANFECIDDKYDLEALKQRLIPNDEAKGRAIIFGAGHVGSHLSKVLSYVGFDVVIWDDRGKCAEQEFDQNVQLIISPFKDVDDKLNIRENDYVMIMTSGHVADLDVLKQTLKTHPWYIGCIGSKSKTQFLNEELKKYGYRDEDIERIHLPIGFTTGAESPEEIAVSIAAELILSRSIKEKRRKVEGMKNK
jgi:xanthine dehydrogenase accessory factor